MVLVDMVICGKDLDEVKVLEVKKYVEEVMANCSSEFDYVCV